MDILCFAIWCKMQHSNSIIFNLGTRELMRLLKIGYGRATNLLNAIKTDGLFEIKDDKRFLVKSFKDKTIKHTKKGKIYRGANVFVLEVNKDYTLKEIYERLNELLFLRPIGSEESNKSHMNGKKDSLCRASFITMREFEKEVGMSYGSVQAIKKRLLAKQEINSQCAEMYMADGRNEEEIKRLLAKTGRKGFTFEKGDHKYIVIPCKYAIICQKTKASCGRHKIYGYHKGGIDGTTKKGVYAEHGIFGMPD